MSAFPLFEGGNAVRFSHFVFFVSGLASSFVFLPFLRVAFWKNFRERTFVFGWLCWSCVFWWVFAYVFALIFGVSLPRVFGKILLMSGLVFFWVRSLFLRFFADVVFVCCCFFERQSSGSNRTPLHTRTCFACSFFLLCVPPLLSVSPVLAVRPSPFLFCGHTFSSKPE